MMKYAPLFAKAAWTTLGIGATGIFLSFLAGLVISVIRYRKIPFLLPLSTAYVELSRNTPLLVQLFFLYFGLPKAGIHISGETCAAVGLTFLGGSYMAEALRSGIESVSVSQYESAAALGLTEHQIFRFVVLPQAFTVSLPPLCANVLFLIKETSVFSVCAVPDLMYIAKDLIGLYYKTDETLWMLVISYLIILLPISAGASLLERRLRQDHTGIRILFEGSNGLRLLSGLWTTVEISLLSVIGSVIFGLFTGLFMTLQNRAAKLISRFYLEFIRIMPQLVLLFIAYFGITRAFGISLSGFAASVIVFILWGTAEMGDLVRGALISIPKNQYESAEALGLSRRQMYRFIIIPQSLRRLLPPAINLFTRIIKTTSLVVLIGVVEMLKTGQQIIEANRYTAPDAALWIYAAIFFLYFLACYPLSRMAAYLEKKWTD